MGDLKATAPLGIMYLDGEGVAPDPSQALKLFQMTEFLTAVRNGPPEALLAMGRRYELGLGIAVDYFAAIKY